jgi:hypothetical protein
MHMVIATSQLTRWANFYVLAGSAAAALTGLQFVVVALSAQMRLRSVDGGIEAFSSPTVVYFSAVLLLSALLCAPWDGLAVLAILVTVSGAAGMGYTGLVSWRAKRFADYRLVLEDWLWHVAFPLTAQAMLLVAGLMLVRRPAGALFTIAAATLLLLVIGIHNAWDTVTYLVTHRLEYQHDDDRREPPSA